MDACTLIRSLQVASAIALFYYFMSLPEAVSASFTMLYLPDGQHVIGKMLYLGVPASQNHYFQTIVGVEL
jgi:hypothetical protein